MVPSKAAVLLITIELAVVFPREMVAPLTEVFPTTKPVEVTLVVPVEFATLE